MMLHAGGLGRADAIKISRPAKTISCSMAREWMK
jgi:hypothetical protein